MNSLKDIIQAVDVPLPTTTGEAITNEIGLNIIDLGYVQMLMTDMLHPEKAFIVNKVLQNIAASMNTLVSLTNVTDEALQEAIKQRDAAIEAGHVAIDQRNQAIHELDHVTRAVQQIDQSHPDVAALVLRVWTDAQADIIQQIESQRGA